MTSYVHETIPKENVTHKPIPKVCRYCGKNLIVYGLFKKIYVCKSCGKKQ